MKDQGSNQDIRDLYLRNAPSVGADEIWETVQRRLPASAQRAKQRSAPRRWSGLRVAVFASIAVVLVATAGIGSFMAVRNLAQPGFVLAITDDNIAATDAQSVQWEPLPELHTALNGMGLGFEYALKALVVDPSNPSILYAGAPEGLFKSTDGARTWSELPTLSGQPFMIGIDPASPSTVYAGTFAGDAERLLRSDDDGLSWLDLSVADRLYGYDFGIWFDTATTPSTVYVLGRGNVWRSTDRGATWTPVGADEQDLAFSRVATNPVLSSTFSGYSGDALTPQVRVLRDRILETLWNSFEGKLTVYSMAFKPYSPIAYAATSVGIVRAGWGLGYGLEDGAWKLVLGAGGEGSVVVAPSSPDTLYAWNPAGLFRSREGGTNWTRRTGTGLVSTPAGTGTVQGKLVLVGAESPDTLFAMTDRLLRSTDGGDTWSPVLEGMSAARSGGNLVQDHQNPTVLFATTDSGQLLKSMDTGATWTPVAPGRGVAPVVSAALDGHTPAVIYAVQRQSDGGASTLSRSFDGGSTWETVEAEGLGKYIRQVLFDPVRRDTIYVVCGRGAGDASLYRSVDGGATWVTAYQDTEGGAPLVDLGFTDATHATVVLRSTPGRLLRSTDGGASWADVAVAG
jgi:photosystem II stability/assembly factor-like uncharacterized protein